MKRALLSVAMLAGLLVGTTVQAQGPYGYQSPYGHQGHRMHRGPMMSHRRTQELSGPAAQLKMGMDKLIEFLGNKENLQKQRLAAFLNMEIAPFFDFSYMAKMAAGPMARNMSDQQRVKMTARIKQHFLTTMARRLTGYSNQQVRYLAQRMGKNGRTATASVAVKGAQGYPSRLDFRLYKDGETWKVYDVSANGQSAVAYFRKEFRQRMRQRQYGAAPYGGYPR